MLAAASTEARQLEFFVENRIGGTDNVFQSADTFDADEQADGFWELVPRLVVKDRQDELTYDFRYQPILTKYFGAGDDTTEGDGWDHYTRGDVDWSITPRDFVGIEGSFVNSRRIRAELISSGVDPEINASSGQRVSRALSTVYYSRYFTPKLSGRIDYALDDLDFNRRDQTDSRAHTGGAGLNYAINPLTSIGTRISIRYRDSKTNQVGILPPPFPPSASLFETRSESRTINLSFSISRQLTKSISVSVQAGPSFIETETDRELGIGFTSKSHTNDESIFAAVSARKEWRKGLMELVYTRYETGGGNTVNASIVDDVSLYAEYQFDKRWEAWVSLGWNRRDELSDDLAISNPRDVTRYRVVGTLTRNILPRLDVVARVDFIHRKEDQELRPDDPEAEVVTGWLSLQYNFDPIVF